MYNFKCNINLSQALCFQLEMCVYFKPTNFNWKHMTLLKFKQNYSILDKSKSENDKVDLQELLKV